MALLGNTRTTAEAGSGTERVTCNDNFTLDWLLRSGALADRGDPIAATSQLYSATDAKIIYVSFAGAAWAAVTATPTGAAGNLGQMRSADQVEERNLPADAPLDKLRIVRAGSGAVASVLGCHVFVRKMVPGLGDTVFHIGNRNAMTGGGGIYADATMTNAETEKTVTFGTPIPLTDIDGENCLFLSCATGNAGGHSDYSITFS